MFKLRNLVLVVVAFTLGGCASEFVSSAIAIPGTVVDAVGSVGSATWNLLTGWIPGSGGETIEVIKKGNGETHIETSDSKSPLIKSP